ncbi:hypothetical protein A4X06_0g2711 [Tilletia controversa]|uniref:Uncharacterized protein n=1 Tax=Tilletia controversa TaxID=13291 RepID=A0A8X7MX62_9BASI|nr:hypothetical protein A4X06_0g2711 [Tilletia controversa]
MLRTLRTKVSAHRLRKEHPIPVSPVAAQGRDFPSLPRSPTQNAAAPVWKVPQAPSESNGQLTPGLTPDVSPALSSPLSLPTPTDFQTSRDKHDVFDVSDLGNLAQNTVLMHQQADDRPQNISQAMIQNVWKRDEAKFLLDPPTPVGLGLTATDPRTGADYAFPTPEQLISLNTRQDAMMAAESKGHTIVAQPSQGSPVGDYGRKQSLKVDTIPVSNSNLSLLTIDTQGGLGLSFDSPVVGPGSNGLMSLIQSTAFPSPPVRMLQPEFTTGGSSEATPDEDKDIKPSTPSPHLAEPAGQTSRDNSDKRMSKLRPFELSQAVETSSLAQRRKARFDAEHTTDRDSRAAEDEKLERSLLPFPKEPQSFKDRYPPSIGSRRPMLGPLPPTPTSASPLPRRVDPRPAHLSPHLTLEEAVQMSLEGPASASRLSVTPRRFSGLTYLRDGVPISGGAADTPTRLPSLLNPLSEQMTTDTRRALSQRFRGTHHDQHSNVLQPHRGSESRPFFSRLAGAIGLSDNDATSDFVTASPDAFHTPNLPWASANSQSPGSPSVPTRPVHPPNMACLAGCCSPSRSADSSLTTFHPIARTGSSKSLRRLASNDFLHCRGSAAGLKVPDVPDLPREIKKAKSSPELKGAFKSTPLSDKTGVVEVEATPGKKKKNEQQRKLNKSVGSIRFLVRAFQRATGETELPRNLSTAAVAHDEDSRSTRRRSVDSDESWGPSQHEMPLPDVPPQSMAAFQTPPVPTFSSPPVPVMSSPFAPGEFTAKRHLEPREEPEALRIDRSAALRLSTVASAMLASASSMSILSIAESDVAKGGSQRSIVPAAIPSTSLGTLQRGFQFPSVKEHASLARAQPSSGQDGPMHGVLRPPFEMVRERIDERQGRSNVESVFPRMTPLPRNLASGADFKGDDSLARTSPSSSQVFSCDFTHSYGDRTRGMSWDSGAFSLERQLERLRELESPDQTTSQESHSSPRYRSRSANDSVERQSHVRLTGELLNRAPAGSKVLLPLALAPAPSPLPPPPACTLPSPPRPPPRPLTATTPAAARILASNIANIAAASSSLRLHVQLTTPFDELPISDPKISTALPRPALPRLDIEEVPLLAGTGFAF